MFSGEQRVVMCWMKTIQVLSALALVFPLITESKVGDWKNYTNMQHVRAVVSDGSAIWAATSGGVFRFNPADSMYQKFTNSEGLSTNDATAITIDPEGRIWIGYQTGNIDVYNPQTGRWRYIADIQKHSSQIKRINAFYVSADEIYIATSFGVAVFSRTRFEFIDTYTNFSTASATLLQPDVASVIKFNNRVFAATSGGIVASKIGAVNLAAPESWETLSLITTGNNFAVFTGELYASTAVGMITFLNNAWSIANGITTNVKIITALDTALLFVEGNLLKSLNTFGAVSTLNAAIPSAVTGGGMTQQKVLYVGIAQNGIGLLNEQSAWTIYAPDGPSSNSFYQIMVDDDGVLWSGTGTGGGSGFFSFNGTRWRNYTPANTPLLATGDCFGIMPGPNNSKWVSTWGAGLVVVNSAGQVVRRFDYYDPGFIGVIDAGIPSYTVPGRVAVDNNGNVWTTIFASLSKDTVVWKWNGGADSSSWVSYPGSPYGSPASFMGGIVIDHNNTKWFTNSFSGRNLDKYDFACVFFNENSSISGTLNGWGVITENDGLTNENIYSIAVDKSGNVWLGTGNGITIITEPSNPTNRVTQVQLSAVREQIINSIAVDALDNKWIGTSSRGVLVLSPDGTQLLEQYTVENTGGKLVHNNVFSIAFDKKKGIAYFGTEKGLSSLEIPSIAVKTSLATIDLSPNPVYLPDHDAVEIRGLVEESIIKVLTINGKVLKQFPAQGGGRAFWDCKDGEGNSVASGIYIITAHDKSGTQAASAKIAVIKK